MSENERTPVRLDLSHVCTIPAGKSGKAAKKQLANEKKTRLNRIRRLAKADAGDGLLVMLIAPDPKLCRYIMKKLGHVIPFFVRAHSDGKCPEAAGEMSWLMCRCEERGMRTMWLDLTGAEKLDKKQVLCLVAGELIRVLEAPAPVRTPVVPEEVQEISPDTVPVEEKDEAVLQETAPSEEEPVAAEPVEESQEVTESKEEPVVAEPLGEPQEAAESEEESVEVAEPVEEPQEAAESVEVTVVVADPVEELQETAEPEEMSMAAAEPAVTEEISTPEESGEAAPEKAEAEKTAPVKKRTRKATPKAEGEVPAKPKRKRQPKAPLTVGETLARRRRQMGLEE